MIETKKDAGRCERPARTSKHFKYRPEPAICQPRPLRKRELEVWNTIERHDKRWGVFYVARYLGWNHGTVSRIVHELAALGLLFVGDPHRAGRGRPYRPLYANRREFAAYLKAVECTQSRTKIETCPEPRPMQDTGISKPETRSVRPYENQALAETPSNPHPDGETAASGAGPDSTGLIIETARVREDPKDPSLNPDPESLEVSKYGTYGASAERGENTDEELVRGRGQRKTPKAGKRDTLFETVKAWAIEEGIEGDPNGSPINWHIAKRSIARLQEAYREFGIEAFRFAWVGYNAAEWTDCPTWSGLIADFDAWVRAGRELESQRIENNRSRPRSTYTDAAWEAECRRLRSPNWKPAQDLDVDEEFLSDDCPAEYTPSPQPRPATPEETAASNAALVAMIESRRLEAVEMGRRARENARSQSRIPELVKTVTDSEASDMRYVRGEPDPMTPLSDLLGGLSLKPRGSARWSDSE